MTMVDGEWLRMASENGCYRGGLFNGGGMVVREVVSLLEEKGFVTKADCLIEGVWSC